MQSSNERTTSRWLQALMTVLLGALLLAGTGARAATETITHIHGDISGSPLAATSDTGAVVWKESYRAYGERWVNAPASAQQSQWFHGKEQDTATGLQYFGARYYDPAVGRFLGIDPVGYQDGNLHSFNRYAYGNNNPVRYADPDGQWAEDALLALPGMYFGSRSLVDNLKQGNWGAAAVDAGGLVADGIALALPGVPGGFGLGIKATREGAEAAARGVGKYEVGTYDALKSRSAAGDGLDIHHAMQKNPAGQAVSGYNPTNGPSIAVPRGVHARIPTLKGEYTGTARDLLAKDVRDLRNNTNAPNSALRDLIVLNRQMYPGALGK